MKIELITLHRVTNFGSLLQTYATQRVLFQMGYEVETIDFVPEGLSFRRAIWPKGYGYLKKAVKLLPNIIVNTVQYCMVDKFLKKEITLSLKRYHRYQQLMQDIPNADIYISGSDQLWNTQNNNPPDDLKAYYLQFVPNNTKKIAYAGSFGRYDFSETEKKEIYKWLNEYKAVSVREKDAVDFLNNMGICDVAHVLDPTMLLNKNEWSSFIKKSRPNYKYVFVYNLNRNKKIEELAKKIKEIKGIKIVNFADTFEFIYGAKNKMFNSPKDLLYYIYYAEYVVTDSFHGTVFSINFNKNFFTYDAPRFNSRLESVLNKFNLKQERYIRSVEDGVDRLNDEIDWTNVNQILDIEREYSMSYLRKALSNE